MSKIYRLLDITDGTWLQDYANSTTVTLTNLSERGSVLARSAVDKPNKILLWWRECENIAPTDTSLQVLEWLNAKTENELNQFQQTTDDFQMFAEYVYHVLRILKSMLTSQSVWHHLLVICDSAPPRTIDHLVTATCV